MAHVFIGQNGSRQVAHDLMHIDQNAPALLQVKGNRLDVRIDLAPLLRRATPASPGTEAATLHSAWRSHIALQLSEVPGPVITNNLAFHVFNTKGDGLFDRMIILIVALAPNLLWIGRHPFAGLLN